MKEFINYKIVPLMSSTFDTFLKNNQNFPHNIPRNKQFLITLFKIPSTNFLNGKTQKKRNFENIS